MGQWGEGVFWGFTVLGFHGVSKQIGKLTNKLQIKNVVHGNVTNYNIQLLNYKLKPITKQYI